MVNLCVEYTEVRKSQWGNTLVTQQRDGAGRCRRVSQGDHCKVMRDICMQVWHSAYNRTDVHSHLCARKTHNKRTQEMTEKGMCEGSLLGS